MSLALQKGFSRASFWAGLERTFRHSFCASLTAQATARDHKDRESALQKTSTNSGLAITASTWAKFVILWISSSPKRPGSHAKPHAAVQKCRFFFQTNKLRSSPLSNEHRSFGVRLKQNVSNWRGPLTEDEWVNKARMWENLFHLHGSCKNKPLIAYIKKMIQVRSRTFRHVGSFSDFSGHGTFASLLQTRDLQFVARLVCCPWLPVLRPTY